MKKIILLLVMLIPFFTGCTSIDTNIKIQKNKSAKITTKLTYDGYIEDKSDYTARLIYDNYEKFLDKDYKIETDNSNKKSKITGTKSVKNLLKEDLDLSSLGFQTNIHEGRYISVKKNFFVTFYNIDMIYNTPEIAKQIIISEKENKKSSLMTPEYFQKYGDINDLADTSQGHKDFAQNFDESTLILAKDNTKVKNIPKETTKKSYSINDLKNTFSIELPMFASFNNADFNTGTKYIWHLRNESPTIIKLQYVVYSSFSIVLILITGLLLLIYMARRILRHDGQKRVGK